MPRCAPTRHLRNELLGPLACSTYRGHQRKADRLLSCVCMPPRPQVEPDRQWLKSLGLPQLPGDDTAAQITTLTVPNLDYGYPEELGGRCASRASPQRPRPRHNIPPHVLTTRSPMP